MVFIFCVNGIVIYVDVNVIVVQDEDGNDYIYFLQKYQCFNQDICLNQCLIVCCGDLVIVGQVMVDGLVCEGGEIVLGQNVLIVYMFWEGYNYEDVLLVSECFVIEDFYIFVYIEKYEIEVCQIKFGFEEIICEIFNVVEESFGNFDEMGIICVGVFVESGDIFVGKVMFKGEFDQLLEEKLLCVIFGEKVCDVCDNFLWVFGIECGCVVDVCIYIGEQGDELFFGVNMVVWVYVVQCCKIQVGDKMVGCYGNKGIISCIFFWEDMFYLFDGILVDIVFNFLGVLSWMNVGQVFELLMGWVVFNLDCCVCIVFFDEMYGVEKFQQIVEIFFKEVVKQFGKGWVYDFEDFGKLQLWDGCIGLFFDQLVVVGYFYFFKLVYLVDDKIYVCFIGFYFFVIQQFLGGKV